MAKIFLVLGLLSLPTNYLNFFDGLESSFNTASFDAFSNLISNNKRKMNSQLKFKKEVHYIDFSIKPPTTRENAIKMFSEIVNSFPEDYEFNMKIIGSAQSQLIPIDDNASE